MTASDFLWALAATLGMLALVVLVVRLDGVPDPGEGDETGPRPRPPVGRRVAGQRARGHRACGNRWRSTARHQGQCLGNGLTSRRCG